MGLEDRDVARSQRFVVEIHPQYASQTADDRNLRYSRMAGELDLDFVGHLAQVGRRCFRAPQGIGDDGDVVDGAWFDDRRHDAGRHAVNGGLDLRVDPDRGLIGIGADKEPNDDETTQGFDIE